MWNVSYECLTRRGLGGVMAQMPLFDPVRLEEPFQKGFSTALTLLYKPNRSPLQAANGERKVRDSRYFGFSRGIANRRCPGGCGGPLPDQSSAPRRETAPSSLTSPTGAPARRWRKRTASASPTRPPPIPLRIMAMRSPRREHWVNSPLGRRLAVQSMGLHQVVNLRPGKAGDAHHLMNIA